MSKKPKHNLIKMALERNSVKLVNADRALDCEDEINNLFNSDGFIIFAVKDERWHQWSLKKEDIDNVFIQNLLGLNKDTYVALNTFKSTKRLISNLFGLNALWSDLDYYNTKYKGKTYQEMIDILSENEFIKKLPPSFYIYSGNGMYPIWLLESAHAQKTLPLWNKLMSVIHENLESYGADPKSAEPAHVLRLAGSKNSKTNKNSKIVRDMCLFNPKRYSLKNISDIILPALEYSKEEWIALKKKKRKTKKEKEACKVKSLFNIHSLNFARMQDLQTIVELRNGQPGKMRETILFLYRYWGNSFWKDKNKALNETLEFNKMFSEPLEEKEVIEATKRAEVASEIWEVKLKEYWELEKKPSVGAFFRNTGCYVYSNKTLIELLEIAQEEMISLNTIFNNQEKLRRKNLKRKEDRRNENGLHSREQAKMDKIYKIIDLLEKGYKQKDIVLELGYGKSTVSEYVKEIRSKNITKPRNVEENIIDIEFTRITDNELKLMIV